MNHIYIGFTLSFICLFLAYFILPKLVIVAVLCVVLAGLYFKDDFTLFRYIATHVASFYSWISDISLSIQTMYHQSNNTNFPIRKPTENNGAVSKKLDRIHHGSSYNLSTSYVVDNKSLNASSGIWNSGATFPSPIGLTSFSSRTQQSLQEMSKLSIGHHVRGETSTPIHYSKSNNSSKSPITITHPGYMRTTADLSRSGSSPLPAFRDHSPNVENKPPLNEKYRLYADVSSPGFCGRIADRLNEENTIHQTKYDTVGAFPVVNLKSQSPRIKIKTPVRVRLAPPSNELVQYNYGANSQPKPSAMGPDDSMKSVLQVLKEISRKRIHSHVDEDDEEISKRSRVADSQFGNDGLLHTSLLQQTIQGKRVREESSPNEDDKKRHKASLKNNEILSSLSSSVSVRPPHLKTAKRKAQSIDDSLTSTPVLGKLLKVQTEVTTPTLTNRITAPDSGGATTAAAKIVKETKRSSPVISSPVPPPAVVETVATHKEPPRGEEKEEEGAVSRLLGRMSNQPSHSVPINIPVKKNVFMSTNDLSLSPPKENRLAAMIAVLGGPSEQSELEGPQSEPQKQPERLIKGKALFTTPESPATPESAKLKKSVTFSEALTSTKIFEKDEPDGGSLNKVNSVAVPSTPLSSFNASGNTTSSGLKMGSESPNAAKPLTLNFSSPSSAPRKEASKPNESTNLTTNSLTSIVSFNLSSPGKVQTLPYKSPSSFPILPRVSSNGSTNVSSPGGFNFPANSSLSDTSKGDSPKPNSPAVKPFASFGGETKTSQPDSGFPSLFSPATSTTAQSVSTAEQNKSMFNMFGNKDNSTPPATVENGNKPLVNGFAPTSSSSSPFALQASANKPPSNTPNSSVSQVASPYSFGSTSGFSASSASSLSTKPLASSAQQSTAANVSAPQPNALTSNAASPSVNMFSSVISKSSPFAAGGIQAPAAFGNGSPRPLSSNSQTSQANTIFGSAPSQGGFGSSTSLQNGTVSSSGATANNNMFGNASTTIKPIAFGNESNRVTQQSTVFGFSGTAATTQASSPFGISLNSSTTTASTMFANNTPTSKTPTMFGSTTTSNTPAMFGSTTSSNNPTMFGSTTTSNTSTMFGNATTTNTPTMFGSTTTSNTPTMFGSTTTANTPTMFGNTTTSNTPTMFGNATTAKSASVFGNPTSIGSQSSPFSAPSTTAQPSLFGTATSSDASKNVFAGANNPTPNFGGLGTTPSSSFGNQNNPTSTFGSQKTTAASTFGNQSNPTFAFGSQNSTNTAGGFGSSGTFGANSTSSNTGEAKPPAFGAGSPFMFGNSTAGKPTESVKPLGTATQFAFSATAQTSSPAQPSVPSFGAAPPSFGQSAPPPTFGAATTQPAASSTFQFGQASSSAAPAFQFNAAPPTVGGGMFSIGSGGSTTSRPKTTALRRSHKRT